MVTEDYVSFETAKLLKEKGFDGLVHYAYDDKGMFWSKTYNAEESNIGIYAAPTLQMAMKWLREVHKLHIELNWNYANQQYSFQIWKIGKSQPEIYSLDLWHDNHKYAGEWNYEQACEAAIKYCLENLI